MSTNYQAQRAKLAEILDRLQQPDVDLDEAVKLYQQGLDVAKKCEELLASAENKIVTLGKQ